MSDRYAIIDSNNKAVNFILWDGDTEYSPGEGFTLVLIPEGTSYNFGWVWDGQSFVDPNPPAVVEEVN